MKENLIRYVSPELLEDGECQAPADLWALGYYFIIFYFIAKKDALSIGCLWDSLLFMKLQNI